jgi:hypothetical protein
VSYRSPLGNNYGWNVNAEHRYVSRELDEANHSTLAVCAVAQDPELSKIEQTLGHRVILAVKLGKYTMHVRIYKLEQVERKPDNLPSRMAQRDTSAFMVFNNHGGVEMLEGRLREMAQGSVPAFYADRRLSPQKVQAMDGMQVQLTGTMPAKFGLPRAAAPLSEDEELVEVPLGPEPPSLESA